MRLRRIGVLVAVLVCACAVAGSNATAAGEEIVVESTALDPTDPIFWIDPTVASSVQSFHLTNLTCLPLLEFDEVTGELTPEAATGMPTVSPDGRTYTFSVETGHAFSDGEVVTLLSYKRFVERATSPAMAASAGFLPLRVYVADIVGAQAFFDGTAGSISGIQVVGDELSIEFIEPRPSFLRNIVPGLCASPSTAPAGFSAAPLPAAGPYYVTSASAAEVVLERNPNYGGSRIQNLGRIRWAPHGSPLAEDYVADAPAAYTAPPGALDLLNPTTAVERLALNTSRAPLDDFDMRRAAALALDRTALATAHGALQPTDQFLAPLMPGFREAAVYPLDGSGAAEAAALLGGATPSVRLCYTSGQPAREAMTALAETQLEAVGFVVERLAYPAPELFGTILPDPASCELGLFTLIPGSLDPGLYLEVTFHGNFIPPNGANFSFFDDPVFNARFDAAETMTPDAARLAAYGDLDVDLAAAAPAVALGIRLRRDVVSGRIGCRILSQVLWGYAVNRLCIEVA